MKKSILSICIMATLTLTVFSCKDKAKEAETKEAETTAVAEVTSEKYTVNVAESSIQWKGFKPTGSHVGTIDLESGVLTTSNGKIDSGTFLITMSSLKDSEGSAKLEGHLKSADFFEVETYPTAVFEVTGVEESEGKTLLSGNLTMKDTKNNVTFPVSVSDENGTLTLTSETFTIDRSKWNVKFKSKSFFSDLGEKFINDEIELTVSVKATKS
ncbi:YceI family protein [Seonamhaeicola maritimus]|uniref:YceI family protein n=1 Tax=Seonamhaeicola maritimus TaxID=2591822 RepID=A0A5C7GL08_9FLAO|nr:YceI family protein [Seonamhaeicola maritimus]TXG39166.1 YceI family protein [Seonamhaeicola maritimus]